MPTVPEIRNISSQDRKPEVFHDPDTKEAARSNRDVRISAEVEIRGQIGQDHEPPDMEGRGLMDHARYCGVVQAIDFILKELGDNEYFDESISDPHDAFDHCRPLPIGLEIFEEMIVPFDRTRGEYRK